MGGAGLAFLWGVITFTGNVQQEQAFPFPGVSHYRGWTVRWRGLGSAYLAFIWGVVTLTSSVRWVWSFTFSGVSHYWGQVWHKSVLALVVGVGLTVGWGVGVGWYKYVLSYIAGLFVQIACVTFVAGWSAERCKGAFGQETGTGSTAGLLEDSWP